MSDPSPRRCTECGESQHLEHMTVEYPESGLPDVLLEDVPVWVCGQNHRETVIPSVSRLHEALGQMLLRKAGTLTGAEVRFLRRRVSQSSREFAQRLGISAVQLSRIENRSRPVTRPLDLLVRLMVAAYASAHAGQPFPADLVHLIDQCERTRTDSAHRLRYSSTQPNEGWEQAGAEASNRS